MAWYIATSARRSRARVGVAGTAEQGSAVGVASLGGDSCAGVDDQFETIDAERPGNGARARPHEGVDVVDAVAEPAERELVAGEPGEEIAGLDHAGESVGDFDEQLVAGVVTERVVHLFEAVEVEHDDERGRSVLERPFADARQVAFERGAVGEAGEEVVVCLELQMAVHQSATDGGAELVGDRPEATEVGVGERLECTFSPADDEYPDHALIRQHGCRAQAIDLPAAGTRHRRRAGPRAIVGRRCEPGAR